MAAACVVPGASGGPLNHNSQGGIACLALRSSFITYVFWGQRYSPMQNLSDIYIYPQTAPPTGTKRLNTRDYGGHFTFKLGNLSSRPRVFNQGWFCTSQPRETMAIPADTLIVVTGWSRGLGLRLAFPQQKIGVLLDACGEQTASQ